MRYISLALTAEGSTDEAFLWPLIYRTAVSLASNATVQEVPFFLKRSAIGNKERAYDICCHAEEFDVFLIHADASNHAIRHIREYISEPIRAEVWRKCAIDPSRIVDLITVSEMESWALACPNSVADAVGYDAWPNRIALEWNPERVESIPDPKAILNRALTSLGYRVTSQSYTEALESIAGHIPLNILDRLQSYQEFRDSFRNALRSLRAAN